MIDVLPTSHSAIFARPTRKMSPSLLLAILVAVGLHLLLAFYLLTTNFVRPMPPDTVAEPGPLITTIERMPTKTNDKPPPPVNHTMNVHTPISTTPTIDDTPIIPYKGPGITVGPVVLPDGPVVTAGPDTGPGTVEPTYITPRWTQFPDGATLAEYYPQVAIDNDRTGQAVVECSILDTAGRVSCSVVSETPKGYGFGAATVKMVEAKGRVDTNAGNIKPGAKLLVTLKWLLGDS